MGRILNLRRMSWRDRSPQALADRGIVLIDRRTKWGNPFHLHPFTTRKAVLEKHRQWLWQQIVSGRITIEELAELHDKDLACWCHPLGCHGDTLKRAALWAHSVIEAKLGIDAGERECQPTTQRRATTMR